MFVGTVGIYYWLIVYCTARDYMWCVYLFPSVHLEQLGVDAGRQRVDQMDLESVGGLEGQRARYARQQDGGGVCPPNSLYLLAFQHCSMMMSAN